jgi:hypothetical protein
VRADRRHAVGEDAADVARDELVDRELLRELHHEARQLLERRLRPAARAQVDREVDPARDPLRVHDAVGDDALDGQRLEVRTAGVEEERLLAVVDRHLGHRGVDRAKPERLSRPLAAQRAALVAEHVARRLRPQVPEQGVGLDLCHVVPSVIWSD